MSARSICELDKYKTHMDDSVVSSRLAERVCSAGTPISPAVLNHRSVPRRGSLVLVLCPVGSDIYRPPPAPGFPPLLE